MASVRNNGVGRSRAPYTPGSNEHITTFVYEYDRGSRLTAISDPADSAEAPPAAVSGRRRGQQRQKGKRTKSRGRRGPAE
jgi:hypothetical protein